MKTLIATLELSESTSGRTRERCPSVVFSCGGTEIVAIRTDTEQPELPIASESITAIDIHDDVLSRVIDELAWLREIDRVLSPNGELRLTLPADGRLAWLDAMNVYRYMVDIGKRGHAPDAALPTGWNRHYPRASVTSMLEEAGFSHIQISSANYADREIRMLAALVWRNWIRGIRSAEREAFAMFGARQPGKHFFPLHTTWSISAVKRQEDAPSDQ